MNLKATYKYQLREYKNSVIIYYLVVVLVYIFFGVSTSIMEETNFQSTGGIELSTVIFLFVIGLNSFKETFLMLLQNGISRRTMFLGRMMTAVTLSFGMMAIDRIFLSIIKSGDKEAFRVNGLYEEFFSHGTKGIWKPLYSLSVFIS